MDVFLLMLMLSTLKKRQGRLVRPLKQTPIGEVDTSATSLPPATVLGHGPWARKHKCVWCKGAHCPRQTVHPHTWTLLVAVIRSDSCLPCGHREHLSRLPSSCLSQRLISSSTNVCCLLGVLLWRSSMPNNHRPSNDRGLNRA